MYGSINHRIYEIGVSSPEPGDLIKSPEQSNHLNSSTESNSNSEKSNEIDNVGPVERHYQENNEDHEEKKWGKREEKKRDKKYARTI